jgi:aldehyde:ferredoxin oxidoreductase
VYAFDRDEGTGAVRLSPEPVHVGRLHDFDAMLDRYYRLRGWDEDGVPTLETLRRLKLEEYLGEIL